jgi:hypothetical protein
MDRSFSILVPSGASTKPDQVHSWRGFDALRPQQVATTLFGTTPTLATADRRIRAHEGASVRTWLPQRSG